MTVITTPMIVYRQGDDVPGERIKADPSLRGLHLTT